MLYRIWCLIVKELQAIFSSKAGRFMLITPVILQTALFPFAATLEVQNATLLIYNQDPGPAGRELVQRLAQTAAFTHIISAYNTTELQRRIDQQDALLALTIPHDLSTRMDLQQRAALQVVLDGRRSNSAQIASGYISQIVNSYASERGLRSPVEVRVRHFYNPNTNYRWHVVPSLVAIITTLGCLIVTALSVAREREEGTFDQLLVSPLTPAYIMAGKAIPGILVALAQGSLIALAARFIYQIPFTGSLLVLLFGIVAYGLALAGVGLFISSVSSTQQQAFLGVFSFMVPAVILSGYLAPQENMPLFFQWLGHLDPLTYMIRIVKGVFLKDLFWAEAWSHIWPLLLIAIGTLSSALLLFRRHIA